MAKGYIYLHKQLLDHWLWQDKPFSKGQAWIDLLLLANYEDKKTMHRGRLITCKRGTVNLSIMELSKRWGWHWKTTKKFILEMERDNMCTLKCTTECTTITIEKYDDFQILGKQNAQRNAKQNAKQSENQMPNGMPITNKDNKRIIKENENAPLPDDEIDPDWNDDDWVDAKDLKLEGDY